MNKAFIIGISGQDGSYLAELLLERGYEVHGLVRTEKHNKNLKTIDNQITFYNGDLTDTINLRKLLQHIMPDEIYNFGAESNSLISFELPEHTTNIDSFATLSILDFIREYSSKKSIKFFHASSSELFAKSKESPSDSKILFHPRSPYGCSKLFSYWLTSNYRESHNMKVCSGIFFNHESPRRSDNFVTRKITKGMSRLKFFDGPPISLGNINAKRDWGHAKDYVEAAWLMLQKEEQKDYIICMNETHSVREFVEIAAKYLNFDLYWNGSGIDEVGIDRNTGKTIININPIYYRQLDDDCIIFNDNTDIKRDLSWEPKYSFEDLILDMINHDLEIAKNGRN